MPTGKQAKEQLLGNVLLTDDYFGELLIDARSASAKLLNYLTFGFKGGVIGDGPMFGVLVSGCLVSGCQVSPKDLPDTRHQSRDACRQCVIA
jgi:hypothetical protein